MSNNTTETLAQIEAMREEGFSWQDVADSLVLGSEASARRLHKKLLKDKEREEHEHSDFTRESLIEGAYSRPKPKRKRYIISTITPMSETNRDCFRTLYNMAKELDAGLILLLGRSHNRPMQEQVHYYDPWIKEFIKFKDKDKRIILTNEFKFNSSVVAVDLQINPQQANPLTGIKDLHFGGRTPSIIVASTQMAFESVARGNGKKPRAIVATGTLSMPKYLRDYRTGRMAEQNHTFGAYILEIKNDKEFFIRDLEFAEDGSVCDIAGKKCKRYTPNGSKQTRAELMVLGDTHVGHDDLKHRKLQEKLGKIVNPKVLALHDVIDGNSVSHHTWGTPFDRHNASFFSIADELEAVRKYLESLAKIFPKAQKYIVDSNHHHHIDGYLNKGRYINDKPNYEIGHRMIVDKLDGIDPFIKRVDPNGRYIWTTDKDDFYVAGIHFTSHGDRGPNGSRGSIKNLAPVLMKAFIAHSHSPGRYRNIVQIGHSSAEDHGYNRGPSSWMKADGIGYEGGQRQLVIYFNGDFCL